MLSAKLQILGSLLDFLKIRKKDPVVSTQAPNGDPAITTLIKETCYPCLICASFVAGYFVGVSGAL